MRVKILGTGLTGLVGSRVVKLLADKYEFENISRSSGVDIVDRNQVLEKIKSTDAQIVLHLAAKVNVDACELDKPLGKNGEAWKVNVEGTRSIADACFKTNKKIIYISTDSVFDGENPPKEGYSEDDIPNPVNWYALTKYEGEKIVKSLKSPWLIVRIGYPYRAKFEKVDFVRAILKRLQDSLPVEAVSDQFFSPTFIDDIAFALDVLIKENCEGIVHVIGSQNINPYDTAIMIAEEFNLDPSKINKTTRAEFFNNRAPRPFNLLLKNDKITKLGIHMRTLEEGLKEIKSQWDEMLK